MSLDTGPRLHAWMTIDLTAAREFMATHARVLDRRRFELLDGSADASGVLAAPDGYRNADQAIEVLRRNGYEGVG
jgi:hypothetical protein